MLTAEERGRRARKAARVRWAIAWDTEAGRKARSAAYRQRIVRAIATGNPQWLTKEDRLVVSRVLNGSTQARDWLSW